MDIGSSCGHLQRGEISYSSFALTPKGQIETGTLNGLQLADVQVGLALTITSRVTIREQTVLDLINSLLRQQKSSISPYNDVPFSRDCNMMIRETVRAALAEWPLMKTIEVLEIGAGTGNNPPGVLAIPY